MGEQCDPLPFLIAKAQKRLDDRENGTLPPTGENPAIQIVNSNLACKHPRLIYYDVETRTIECADCGRKIDPFDWLVWCAESEVRKKTEVETWKRMRGEYDEADKIKRDHEHFKMQRRCMHKYAKPLSTGGSFCPTCDAFLPPESLSIQGAG